MQAFGLIAMGFMLGVLVTVFFSKKIAMVTVNEAKAVAFDAARTVRDETARVRIAFGAIEQRIHAKIDAWKSGANADVNAAAQDVAKKL